DGTLLRNTGLVRVRPADGALIDAAGRVHPRRFAVGPHTTVKVAGAFTRPGMNSQSLRYNDAVARAVLRSISGADAAAGGRPPPGPSTAVALSRMLTPDVRRHDGHADLPTPAAGGAPADGTAERRGPPLDQPGDPDRCPGRGRRRRRGHRRHRGARARPR